MEVRYGSKEDIDRIRDSLKSMWMMHIEKAPGYIDPDAFVSSDLEEYYKHCFDGSDAAYLLVAEESGEIAGFAKADIKEIQSFFFEKRVLYIDDIFTEERFRGKGVASLLLKRAEELARSKGLKWMKARIYAFNDAAQRTFASAGYQNLYSEYFKKLG